MKNWWRKILNKWHPEGIPWPGSALYNAVSQTDVFGRHYALVADHVKNYCRAGAVLDVGTGPGWLLLALHRSLPELSLSGADISPAMVATASRNMEKAGCRQAIDLKVASADALPYPDDAFDAVVSTGSLHHWKRPVTALNEIHRVLKAGGYGLIYDLVRKLPPKVAAKARQEFGSVRAGLLWLHSFEEPFHATSEMEALASATRFQSGQIQFVGVLCCLVLQKNAIGMQ